MRSTMSALKTRFGYHQSKQTEPGTQSKKTEPGEESAMALVKSFSSINLSSKFEDEGETVQYAGARAFEFGEDPSFWKEHNVQVIIRVRPLSSSEISTQGNTRCVKQDSSQSITWLGHPESRFTFDIVADENVSQEMLFRVAGVPMVDNCMEGYNSCMFAYGQTGSGKTHTMLGDIEGGTRRHSVNCGMTPRVFEYLFSRIQKDKDARREEKLKFTCKCSFLEIYNEQILDLLDPSSANLQIREDTKKGVYVENLTEVEVTSARDVIQQLIQGSANRKVAATNMNRASSRSHSVFTCILESKWESQGVTHYRFARLNLVDLAGSERQKSSGAEGERLKEATNINKSLSTLGLVIMNLVSVSNGKSQHVPYRDSKLTFLLQDSLGGNAKTIIIANISPSNSCSLETLSTLKFAQRAKFIKNHAIVNEDASGDVLALRHENQILKKEISHLRSLVNGGGDDGDVLSVTYPGSPGPFKWDGAQGISSPLLSEKKISHIQKKEYEVALVGAFRREKDKDTALQALAAEHQAALQLAKQREDEIRGLKMRLGFREAGIKRLEAVASGRISAETHLLKEKEEHLREMELLRAQVDRNQEVTRFAMENLRLKEEIRRLKSFCEEGERVRMNEQMTILQNKLLEALDWKLMHESDSANIQNDIQSDTNFLSSNQESSTSPWRTTMNEENEFLRMQAIQNQSELDSLRKRLDFCVEEREKLERHVNELEKVLEVERSSKVAPAEQEQKEQNEVLSLSDQTEIKTMVDAIAAASQREAEAHEMAIFLSKENDGLRMKLKDLIEDNNKLIDLYERTVEENNTKKSSDIPLNPHAESIENNTHDHLTKAAEEKELETQREFNSLKCQLAEMHEENDKLLSLYEKAMQERDELKRVIASGQPKIQYDKVDFTCPEKLVEIDGGQCVAFSKAPISVNDEFVSEKMGPVSTYPQKNQNDLDLEQNQLYEVDVQESSVGSQMNGYSDPNEAEPISQDRMIIDELKEPEELQMQEKLTCVIPANVCKDLDLIKEKLVEAQEKLSYTAQTVNMFGSLEKAQVEIDELSEKISKLETDVQGKENEYACFKVLSSELQEKKDVANKKLLALKNSLRSFSSSVSYFEQREAVARLNLNSSLQNLTQRKEKLACLQVSRHEMMGAVEKLEQSKTQLENCIEKLRLKLEEENRKLESDRVLFAIDNIEKMTGDANWRMSGKATELLKAEEEKTKIHNQMKVKSEKLVEVKRESESLNKKLNKIDCEMQALEVELQKEASVFEKLERKFQKTVQEKGAVLEVTDNGRDEFEKMIVGYYDRLFEANLKEEEMKIIGEEIVVEMCKMEDLKSRRDGAARRKVELVEATTCESRSGCNKMESDLHEIEKSVVELMNSLIEHYI